MVQRPEGPTDAATTPPVDNAGEPAQPVELTAAEKLQQISDAFRGNESGADGQPTPDGEQPDGATDSLPMTLEQMADGLSLDVETLYKTAIPLGDDKSMTLGELKHIAQKDNDITVRELQLEEDHSKRTGELLRAQGELKELIAALPDKALSKEAREKAAAVYDAKVAAERKLTAEAIPEWADETARIEDLSAMVEHLAEYGFPASYLASVVDHRSIRYIRENMRRETRIRAALAKVEEVPPDATGTQSRIAPSKPPAGRPSRSGRVTNAQKAAQVSSIIGRAIRR